MLNFFKQNKKNNKSKLKILSGYNFRYRNVGKESEKNIIKYANHFNFDYEFNKTNLFERDFFWLKIKMLIENLENDNDHDFFLWLDADTFFCRYVNILENVDKSKHIFVHNQYYKSKHKCNLPNTNYLTEVPNVGVLMARNTKWSLNFFKNVWNKRKYLKHYWPDQAAFMDELGNTAEISKITNNNPDKKTISKFYFLNGQWNSMPKKNYKNPENNEVSNFYFDPIIIHLAGIRRRDRILFIKKYKNLFI